MRGPLSEFTGFYLTVGSLCPDRPRNRTLAIAELANFHGAKTSLGKGLCRTRCSAGCAGQVAAAWLETGPVRNQRVRPRGVLLLGPEVRE
jgi:hypothetical protein